MFRILRNKRPLFLVVVLLLFVFLFFVEKKTKFGLKHIYIKNRKTKITWVVFKRKLLNVTHTYNHKKRELFLVLHKKGYVLKKVQTK